MYRRILVTLGNSRADESLIPHVSELAHRLGSELLLLHVADGWAARNYDALKLNESEEIRGDRNYLKATADAISARGIQVETRLVFGNPPEEILKAAISESCDLIAMTTHGHRLIGDIFLGSTIDNVRHRTTIPLLIVRAAQL